MWNEHFGIGIVEYMVKRKFFFLSSINLFYFMYMFYMFFLY